MKVFIIAGELSGDKLGAALMDGLCAEIPEISFDGIGGPLMQDFGLESLFPMKELSLMGIAEILPKYRHLKRRIRQTADAVIAAKPDVLITIDSPDFCLRVARLVKAGSDIRTVHYVAPTVWAWRPERAAKMAAYIDHVLALFPFEPPYMEAAGMDCDFVGHPVVAEPKPNWAETEAFRHANYFAGFKLCVLLGSREGEIRRLAPIFGEALALVASEFTYLNIVIPVAPGLEQLVVDMTRDWYHPPELTDWPILLTEDHGFSKPSVFAACDMALAASGTVSLELAQAGTPMVIAYDMNWFSRKLIQRMLKIDTVTLVNLVSETRVVPECIGAACTPENIAQTIIQLADSADALTAQREAMALTMQRLGDGGDPPGLRAARAILARL
ncbi:UNVERIFIED_CONTAM: hypothetical protein GTU68_009539 [Idotea baltica]|nr:hypothetical protein [Idotea baltica]